jgi:hypothetical protein
VIERVALLALVYRELSAGCSIGARSGPDDIFTDIESGDEALNLVRMIGSSHASAMDWTIIELLGAAGDEDELQQFASDLRELDPARFEALTHAWPKNVPMPATQLDQIERWQAVEDAMERFRSLGLTTPFNDVFGRAVDAATELSGRPRERVLADFLDAEDAGQEWVTNGAR